MKNKKSNMLGGVLLGLGLTALAARLAQRMIETNEERRMAVARAYFSQYGEIDLIYVNAFEKGSGMTGGAVLADGRTFTFSYDKDEMIAREVVA